MFHLPVSLMPDSKSPWISVIIEYPGMTSDKIESILTKPVEERVASLPGIVRLLSVSEEGKCRLNIQYTVGFDTDSAILDLRESVEMARVTFPREVQEPLIIRYDPSETPVIILAFDNAVMDIDALRTMVEFKIKPRLQSLDGVSEVFVSGGSEQEIRVEVDKDKLFARQMDIQDVFREIQFANVDLSPGKIRPNNKDIALTASWKYTSVDEIGKTAVVKDESASIVRVSDLGEVVRSGREKDSVSRIDSKQRVAVYIQKAGTANLTALSKSVRKEVEKIRKEYPDVKVDTTYDQAEPVGKALSNATVSVLWGSLMALLVLSFFFRRKAYALLVALAVPVSILSTFLFFYMKGMGLNVLSLSGLALAAGMLVDNSIIVLEGIVEAKDINRGVFTMEKAVIASTLTTVAVFLPVVFLSKENSLLYGDITLAVVFSIMVSLFVSLVLLPVLVNRIGKEKNVDNKGFLFVALEKVRKLFSLLMLKIGLKKNLDLSFFLDHSGKVLLAVGLMILVVLLVIPSLKQEYVDPIEGDVININVELPAGADLVTTEMKVAEVEEVLNREFSGYIKQVTSRVDKAHAFIVVDREGKRRIKSSKFIASAQKAVSRITGCDIIFSEPSGDGAGGEQKSVDVFLVGPDMERLRELCHEIAEKMKTVPYVKDIVFHFKDPGEVIEAVVDREKASVMGLRPKGISTTMREMLHGPVTSKFFEGERQVDIRVMLKKEGLVDDLDLQGIFLRNNEGRLVSLRSVSEIRRGGQVGKIMRLNKQRSASLSVRYEGVDLNRIVKEIERKIKKMVFPEGVSFELGENVKMLKKNRKEMVLAVFLSIILVYMIMAGIMENLVLPVIIMVTIPLSMASVFIVLFITKTSLNISVYIGLVMLSGIVVNNGILLVEAIKEMISLKYKRKQSLKMKINETIYKKVIINSVTTRMRPLMMTIMTTVFGLLPILLIGGEGSSLWKPLAITIISGLVGSGLLVVVVLPVLFWRIRKIISFI